ncbi:hypothetical protein C8A05DRAFT_41044 [Staphylotrichum tortipilum]|uniref:UNC-45/Cro1/She4 central domain-containing protein n=1 Tax=Staphylotrichum tortipilum TaxID=2831512 RepID=A0AAN6MT06_9PEZI|nr:hypothetical protein C8A05DRAFT_41044 [Staphylotrichum longicolle]
MDAPSINTGADLHGPRPRKRQAAPAPSSERQEQAKQLLDALIAAAKEDDTSKADSAPTPGEDAKSPKEDETVTKLHELTKLFAGDAALVKSGEATVTKVVGDDGFDTIVRLLDMRQPESIRAHAIACASAFFSAAGEGGKDMLACFLWDRRNHGGSDDYVIAFSAAAALFPVVPEFAEEAFLAQVGTAELGALMTRERSADMVGLSCLEMLDAALIRDVCVKAELAEPSSHAEPVETTPRSRRAEYLASVILMKTREPDPVPQPGTSIDDLSKKFIKMLVDDTENVQLFVEGLAFASMQSKVKEELAHDKASLTRLVKILETAPPKSPLVYGALSIFAHLTRYRPAETEEQKRIKQLKAYAAAAGKLQPDPLNDDTHVTERCKLVFAAGLTPVLITRCKSSSVAALTLIISIVSSLSVPPPLRGPLAQQGAVRLLLAAWSGLPEQSHPTPRRTAAQALARILISTDPSLVFRQTPQLAAIRPLASIIPPDPDAETRDLLPTFEALLALTNLASTTDETRAAIVRAAWDDVEEQLFSSNTRVATAAAELVCNIVQNPEEAHALFGDGSPKAATRIKIMLALADAEDEKTRSAAGGALASLVGLGGVVKGVLDQPNGVRTVLGMCRDDSEGLRHRGAVVVGTMVSHEGEVGKEARERLVKGGAVEALTECAKKSRSGEVVQAVVQALEVVLGGGEG